MLGKADAGWEFHSMAVRIIKDNEKNLVVWNEYHPNKYDILRWYNKYVWMSDVKWSRTLTELCRKPTNGTLAAN